MLDLSTSVRLAMINGKGEARRRSGLSYVKVVPVPRTLGETVTLAADPRRYGLTSEEASMVLSMNRKNSKY